MAYGCYFLQPEEEPLPQELLPPFLNEFPLFPLLSPEIRDRIWQLTLPGPRVLYVHGTKTLQGPDNKYTVSTCSYGGKTHPAILSVNRESRSEALRHLTLKFQAYWNLKTDYIYMDVKRWGANDTQKQLADMKKRGLLNDFRNVALPTNILGGDTPKLW